MPAAARVGDTGHGTCPYHGPVTITLTYGSTTTQADGKAVCTIGSTGVASCGHPTVATVGSSTTQVDGKPVHRVGDTGTIAGSGNYVVDTGSPTYFVD